MRLASLARGWSEPEAHAGRERVLSHVAPLDAVLAAVGAAHAELEAAAQDDHLEVVQVANLLAPPAAPVPQDISPPSPKYRRTDPWIECDVPAELGVTKARPVNSQLP